MTKRVECSQCHKRVKNLKLHFRNSHPDLLKDAFGESAKPQSEAKSPSETQEQPRQPDLLERLRAFGVEPEQIMAILSPLVETSVVKTLEKMQLGEAINKKMAEIETRLSQQITTPATSPLPPSNGNTQNTQLRDTILANLAQKLIGGDSPSSFEQMTKMLDMARAVADAFNKPVMEAQAYTRREISDTLKMLRNAGAAPDVARDTLIKRTEG